ncbi:hypothetical protein [Pseudoalteromonas piscicida]|nr:hypothetical protein [Pseudoalteromonas piscicida]
MFNKDYDNAKAKFERMQKVSGGGIFEPEFPQQKSQESQKKD